MTIQEQLQSIKDSKADIKSALQEQGVEVSDTFATYGDGVRNIQRVSGLPISCEQYKIRFSNAKGVKELDTNIFTYEGITNLGGAFSSSEFEVVDITDTYNCTSFSSCFTAALRLREVKGVLNMINLPKAQRTSNYEAGNFANSNTSSLNSVTSTSVRFAHIGWGQTSNSGTYNPWLSPLIGKLDADSRQSFIDALEDYSGDATPMQLKVHADFLANLTDDQKAQATAKGWQIF